MTNARHFLIITTKIRQLFDKMKTLLHTLKIRYFLGLDNEDVLLLPSDRMFPGEELVKIFAHGFIYGETNDAVNSNLIFYN